uniref:Ciliogenesis and planar polarity effector 2 n=1 Tax=Oryzias melastigma TaxID=30732 RepID=A0A3B3CX41_ORYME
MIPPGSVIIADWHLCKESKEFFQKILHKKGRKKFGLLESPVMPPHVSVETVHYKVFLSGKSGVGKTTLAARLAGLNLPSVHHETTGIETTVVYWPVRLRDGGRVLFFRLQLWDCGENALRRFDHLLPSCREQADAVLFLFSFIDRTSFDDLSNQTAKWSDPSVVKVVIGTKYPFLIRPEHEVRSGHVSFWRPYCFFFLNNASDLTFSCTATCQKETSRSFRKGGTCRCCVRVGRSPTGSGTWPPS